jgi:hypothetical protein
MNDKNRHLRNIFINPGFQLRLMSYFVVLFLLTTACLYSTTFLFFWNMKKKGLEVGIPDGHVFYQFLQNQKADLDILFIGLAGLNLLLLLTVGFVLSHRIAGPLHKLSIHLLNLKDTSPDYKTREKDFFQEMTPIVNSLRDKIK